MSLSRIRSLRLAAIVEDCADQLEILGYTLTNKINKAPTVDEKAMRTKLRNRCQEISQQMSQLHLELEEKQSFSCLQQATIEVEQNKAEEGMIRKEREQREQRVEQLKEEHRLKKENEKDMDLLIEDLTDQLNKQQTKNTNIERDVELLRQREQKEKIQSKKLLDDQTEALQKEVTLTKRDHEYSAIFLQKQHVELQEQQKYLEQRIDQMLQEKQQELDDACCKKTVLLDRLAEMKKNFVEMEQMVIKDREEKAKLRQQQAKARAATMIQVWWKECMVRRGFGNKPKREKKRKPKKKKGKKK